MKDSIRIDELLKNAGVSRYLLSGREKKALLNFIKLGETIEGCAKGFYGGGKGILIATNKRLLLVDSRLMSLYSRIIQYDRVSDIKFARRFFDSFLTLRVDDQKVTFRSKSESNLGRLSSYMRGKVLSLENQEQVTDYLNLLDDSSIFELKKKVLLPRHRHGKFPVSLQQ